MPAAVAALPAIVTGTGRSSVPLVCAGRVQSAGSGPADGRLAAVVVVLVRAVRVQERCVWACCATGLATVAVVARSAPDGSAALRLCLLDLRPLRLGLLQMRLTARRQIRAPKTRFAAAAPSHAVAWRTEALAVTASGPIDCWRPYDGRDRSVAPRRSRRALSVRTANGVADAQRQRSAFWALGSGPGRQPASAADRGAEDAGPAGTDAMTQLDPSGADRRHDRNCGQPGRTAGPRRSAPGRGRHGRAPRRLRPARPSSRPRPSASWTRPAQTSGTATAASPVTMARQGGYGGRHTR